MGTHLHSRWFIFIANTNTKKAVEVKEEILQNLRESNDQVDRNNKISEQETTLSQLANASGRLLEENKDFLYTIYNQLDN